MLFPASLPAYSPEGEEGLEILRARIDMGLADQADYGALLALLAEGPEDGCEAWRDRPELREPEGPFAALVFVLGEVCPAPEGRATGGPERKPEGWRTRLSASQSSRPRREEGPAAAPRFRGEGSFPGGAWRLSSRGNGLHERYLALGSRGLSLHAGHIGPALARTRLDFVTGGSFYAGWSGTSGVRGPFHSPRPALDGIGLSARRGPWTAEGAGTWNRLRPRNETAANPPSEAGNPGSGDGSGGERRDALSYWAGLAREGGRKGDGIAFRLQAAHQRYEPAGGRTASFTLGGAAVSGPGAGPLRWRAGIAGSLAAQGGSSAGTRMGGYAEAALGSPGGNAADPGGWRLEIHQADRGWANPLQSPRGHLSDTLDGRWILPGRGEGGLSARSRFPLFFRRGYRMSLAGAGAAGWGWREGLVAGEGRLALVQESGAWTMESGTSLAYRLPASALASPGRGRGWGWGLGLARRQGPWRAKAGFTWKGEGYQGSRPAPLSMECERNGGGTAWKVGLLIGDARHPGHYLGLDLRQSWRAGRKVVAGHGLRLPWTPGGLAGDLGYQIRLEASL